MTKEETENAIKVMQAYIYGKQIEFCTKRDKKWELCSDPLFDWNAFNYRISENPQYRPFKSAKECLQEMQKHNPVGWLFDTVDQFFEFFDCINDWGIHKNGVLEYTFDEAFEEFTFADKTPFGIKIS